MVRRLALLLIVIAVALRIHEVYRGPSRVPAHVAQHVVIVGDSVARGLGAHLAGVVNLGIDGARTYTVRARFDGMRSALRDADAIVMSIGGNDLFGDSMARTASMLMPDLAMRVASSRVDRLVRTIRRENAHARIYLLGLYNPYRASRVGAWVDEQVARWDARMTEQFAKTPAVTVIVIADLFESRESLSAIDHFHPSAAGYAAIAARVGI